MNDKGKYVTCKGCGRYRKHKAKGYCDNCYSKEKYSNNEQYKMCAKERANRWRINNPERYKALQRRFYKEHPERQNYVKEYGKSYYHKEKEWGWLNE